MPGPLERYRLGKLKKRHGGKGLFSDVLNAVTKILPSSDKNARDQYPGETHAVLKLKSGVGRANYMGPGTRIGKRIMRGDPPRTQMDEESQAHDIRYRLAAAAPAEEGKRLMRVADRKFISVAEQIEREGRDSRINTQLGKRGIQAKMLSEDIGKPLYKLSVDPRDDNSAGALERMSSKLRDLETRGFGAKPKRGKEDPMKNMRDALIKQMTR